MADDIIRRAHVNDDVDENLDFILSDETVDEFETILSLDGWNLSRFKRNPIALLNHNGNAVLGRWENIRIERDALRARLALAEAGTSPRIDEIRSLVRQGILKAASVGFIPRESRPRSKAKNDPVLVFTQQDLFEASLVAVPANPNALAQARSLNVSRETLRMVFGESAVDGAGGAGRGSTGESADRNPGIRTRSMTTISEHIEAAQAQLATTRAALETHFSTLDNSNVSDQQMTRTKELNGELSRLTELVATLRQSEIHMGQTATPARVTPPAPPAPPPTSVGTSPAMAAYMGGTSALTVQTARPFALPAREMKPLDYFYRSVAALVKHHGFRQQRTLDETLQADGLGGDQVTRALLQIYTRAASVPADTVTSGWASQLVQTINGDFFDPLLPQVVYPSLRNFGGRFSFGRSGQISLPTRSTTPTVAGSFFAQGAPIPVRQAAFTAVTLGIKKMGVITTMTREIQEHSIPAIEGILRNAMQEDTLGALDAILLDANAATAIRPIGILNGATTAAGTAGGGLAAVVADVKGMLGSLITATAGNVRTPVWIMNPIQAIALTLTQSAGGDFPFKAEVNGNRFLGYPLIQSTLVTAGTVILLDAADFFSAAGDEPRIDVSDQAVLHMEDTTPLPIGTVGSPNTVAAPTRSLWQTDCIGIRLILDVNWAFRRTGMVVTRTAVTW